MSSLPSLVFLPGAGADPAFWRPVGDRLPSAWPKTYLSWPGLGHNPPSPHVSSLLDLVRLTEAHIELGNVDLVAHSFGGAVALMTALRNPEKVRRLVLATSAAGLPVSHLGASDWRSSYREAYPHAAEWVYSAQSNLTEQLSAVTQPTLLLWGDNDPISPVAVGEHLQRALSHATLYVVRGGTHALAVENTDEIAPLVARHLAGDS